MHQARSRTPVVEEGAGAGRTGGGREESEAGVVEDLSQGRSREEPTPRRLVDDENVVPIGHIQRAGGLHVGHVDRVAHQSVARRVPPCDDRRTVHTRDRREDRVMREAPHSSLGHLVEARHELRGHVIRPQAVDDQDERPVLLDVWPRAAARAEAERERPRHE